MARQSQGGSVYKPTGRKPPTYVQNYNNTVNAVNNAIKNSKRETSTYVNNYSNTVKNTNKKAIITSLEKAVDGLDGKSGTLICSSKEEKGNGR